MSNITSGHSAILEEIRRHYPGYHPLVSIAHLAHNCDDDRLKYDCHKTIAKYVEPELKSLEVRGVFDNVRRVSVSLFQEDISDAVLVEPKQQLLTDNESVEKVLNEY